MLKKEQFLGANYAYCSHSLDYFIESMQRLDVDKIEFYAASPHCYLDDMTPERAYDIKRKLDKAGIHSVVLTAEQCNYPISISTSDPFARERSFRYYEKALEIASVLEAPYMQMVAGMHTMEDDPAECFERVTEGMYRVVKKAEKLGITIVLEADTSTPVKNTTDIMTVINSVGSDNLQGLIDTNGIAHANEDFEAAVIRLGDHLKHMHFIDLREPGGHCLVPGEGDLPMEDYLRILDKHGYTGYLTPELWGRNYLANAEEAMKKALDYCRSRAE